MAPGEEYGYDAELEEIKRRKMLELQRKIEEEKRRREQIDAILRQILTPEARARLANLRLVKPELVEIVEQQLITLARSGRVRIPITDEFLKRLLAQIYEQTHREPRIRFLRK